MRAILQHWYSNLSGREQKIVLGGVILLLVLILYVGLYAPLLSLVANKKMELEKNRALLHWVEQIEQPLQLQRRAIKKQPVTEVLSVVEHSLAKASLTKYLKNVQQPDADSVVLILHLVPFDPWVYWLQGVLQRNQLTVVHLRVQRTKALGMVDVQLTLKRA